MIKFYPGSPHAHPVVEPETISAVKSQITELREDDQLTQQQYRPI